MKRNTKTHDQKSARVLIAIWAWVGFSRPLRFVLAFHAFWWSLEVLRSYLTPDGFPPYVRQRLILPQIVLVIAWFVATMTLFVIIARKDDLLSRAVLLSTTFLYIFTAYLIAQELLFSLYFYWCIAQGFFAFWEYLRTGLARKAIQAILARKEPSSGTAPNA